MRRQNYPITDPKQTRGARLFKIQDGRILGRTIFQYTTRTQLQVNCDYKKYDISYTDPVVLNKT